ncbi:NTP transferase domain-containing protein [Henriciella sp. AS95]|uniref:NTP transferase domain-containing protein n=1 Tax=Henriciella sp. AS95 TaxID=3135782 RepID=UPI003170E86F
MVTAQSRYLEHAEDVLTQFLDWSETIGAALVMITGIEGGSVRDLGALMAVNASGDIAGYISGGCIDADVALQAQSAIAAGEPKSLRYGSGSPFTDLPLPCGGAIEIVIEPNPDSTALRACRDRLRARKPATLTLDAAGEFTARYQPKLRMRIAGRGADALALARLAKASGVEIDLQLRDGEDLDHAKACGFHDAIALDTPSDLPANHDDPFTAFVLMFHDNDWEVPLLQQALSGPAFYVGAVGSMRTQQRRTSELLSSGVPESLVRRVRGPVGLIGGMRDASMLAVSTFAEIVEAYHVQKANVFASTAIILLSAGQSARFEEGDKLMTDLEGAPLIRHAARLLETTPCAARLAIVGPDQLDRAAELRRFGWAVIENKEARSGQATSLRAGIEAAQHIPGVQSAMILLADMPDVSPHHLTALAETHAYGKSAAMSESSGVLMPPAMFSEDTFSALCAIGGDQGARSVFASLKNTVTLPITPTEARDIDTLADLHDRMEARYA